MKNEKNSDNIMRVFSILGLLLAIAVILYFTLWHKPETMALIDAEPTAEVSAEPTEEPTMTLLGSTQEPTEEPSENAESEPVAAVDGMETGEDGDIPSDNPEVEPEEPAILTPEEEEALLQEEVNEIAQEILDEILTDDMTDREKAWEIFYFVRHAITYKSRREGDTYASSAYASFTKRVGDCYNFFVASEVLLKQAGIDTVMVQRNGGETHHYWNLVYIEGGWYHFDASPRRTGDPYVCFLQTDAQVAKYNTTYRPDYYEFDPTGLPERAEEAIYWSKYYTPEPEVPEEEAPAEENVPEEVPVTEGEPIVTE